MFCVGMLVQGKSIMYVAPLTEKDASRPHTGHADVGMFWAARSPARHALQKECRQGSICTDARAST